MSQSSNSSSDSSAADSDNRTVTDDENGQSLDSLVTEFFTKWNPDHLSNVWSRRFNELTDLAKGFFNFLFDGTEKEEPSIYFTNAAMKRMIMAFHKWSPWVPGDQCALHRKFKDTVGALCHMITTIEKLKKNKTKLRKFNKKVDEMSEEYSDLEHLLSFGMFVQNVLFLSLFLFEMLIAITQFIFVLNR